MTNEENCLIVSFAFKLYREGRLLELSTSPLAYKELVESLFWSNSQSVSADVRGRAVQSVLRWAVDKLRPSGSHSWVAQSWRAYNTLYYFYIAGHKVADLAEQMAISEQTLYQARAEALETVTQIIFDEISRPQDLIGRRQYAVADRYELHSAEEQTLLRLLSIFGTAMPSKLLHSLAQENKISNVHDAVHHLITANWLVSNENGTEFLLQPELTPYLHTRLSYKERTRWHLAFGAYFVQQQLYLEGARHYFSADAFETSAKLLIEYNREIVNRLQIEELIELIGRFHPSQLSSNTWAHLKIISGDSARQIEDVETALEEYRLALGAKDVQIKALAYYRRAKTWMQINLDEALAHYAYAIQLLKAQNSNPLLVRIYIDRAILYMEELQDVDRAEADLRLAEATISGQERRDWSDLHKAWSRLCILRQDWNGVVEHGQQAWLAANEIQDINRMIITSHNLGMTYAQMERYSSALTYLERSRQLAADGGNRHMIALNTKTIGGVFFMRGDTKRALEHYHEAYDFFSELHNQNWLAHTCYDLAEAYGALGQFPFTIAYFSQGKSLARELKDERLLAEFIELGKKYPMASAELNERQLQALDWVKQHGQITNRDYQQLVEVSARQALRDLNELEELAIFIKSGRGRSTSYHFP